MSILHDSTLACAFCGEEADYRCDDCGRAMCCDCNADLADPDCPAEFCNECVLPEEPSDATND